MQTISTGPRGSWLPVAWLCMLAASVMLSSCAATHPDPPTQADPPAQAAPANPDAQLQLPAPADLPRTTSGTSYGFTWGFDFDAALPHQRVTAGDWSHGEFYSEFEPAGGGGLAEAAYAIFNFRLSSLSEPDPLAKLRWAADLAAESCWVGLANFELNRWDWYAMADGMHATLPDMQPYLTDHPQLSLDQAWMAVVVAGGPPCRLERLRLGDNLRPDAGFITYTLTPEPLTLHFRLDDPDQDGVIATVDWDFNSDGIADDSGALELDHAFDAPGTYSVVASLTDDDGGTAQESIVARVVPWGMESDPVITSRTPAGMDMGADGTLHLAWVDQTGGHGMLRYAVNTGGGWSTQDICAAETFCNPVLRLNPGGEPLILLACSPEGYDNLVVLLAYRDGASWQTEVLDGGALTRDYVQPVLCPYGGTAAAVAFLEYLPQEDPEAQVRFSMDALNGGFETPPLPLAQDSQCQPALVLDAALVPHLAVGAAGMDERFVYATQDGGNWDIEVVEGGIKPGEVRAIIIGPGGQPAVTCQLDEYAGPPTNGWFPIVVYTREGPGSWEFARLPDIDISTPLAGSVRMALIADGEIMLACGDSAGGDWGMHGGTFFAWQDGGDWYSECLGLSDLGGTPVGFGLDPQGRPWMAYINEDLKLATRVQ